MKNDCRFHNDCFTCPFPDCVDGKGVNSRMGAYEARIKAIVLMAEGKSYEEIALDVSRSVRTVARYFGK